MTQSLLGTQFHDLIFGSGPSLTITGFAGDDTLSGGAGDDLLVGDAPGVTLLEDVADALTFAQYGQSDAWTVQDTGDGMQELSQTIETLAGSSYTLSFDLAANVSGGTLSGQVEVIWNGEVIDRFDTTSGAFESHQLTLTGTGGPGVLTFRSLDTVVEGGPVIHDDGPILSYDREVTLNGEVQQVRAVAAGQTNIYQIIDGTMYAYDLETEAYAQLGTDGSVVVNAIGFNQEDDLFYGIAVRDGVDSQGNTVSQRDIVMLDAQGNSYVVGESPYRAWTGDFDDSGNLWVFHSSMDRITMIDVDQLDADGNPVAQTFKFDKALVTDRVWDLAFDAEAQVFHGVVSAAQEGGTAQVFTVDISGVENGGEPVFTAVDIAGTVIDGVYHDGAPRITFGAAMVDRDGTLYVGGNSGDHDMDDSTPSSGGIYRVDTDPDTGAVTLVLMADTPRAFSNDGAFDPRSQGPFSEVDPGALVLIEAPSLVLSPDGINSYDDELTGNGGRDTLEGGVGYDLLIGGSLGDSLSGGAQDDALYGGAGPDYVGSGISIYDANGLRYDMYGNLLPADDDVLSGGAGNDFLSGSAGHDTLSGGIGDDTLHGGSGDDVLAAGDGDDLLQGGGQHDELMGGAGADLMFGGTGNDQMSGGLGADSLRGGPGDDMLSGDAGNDIIDAGFGNDMVQGGDGDDRIRTGTGNDIAFGGDGNDYINGHTGNDIIAGGAGRDRIYGGEGNDMLSGGEGADVFIFRSGDLDGGTDRIVDFDGDVLHLRGLDPLANGQTATEWMAENAVWTEPGVLSLTLDGLTIELVDHQELGDAFVQDVADAIVF